jgi:hypothetical protein
VTSQDWLRDKEVEKHEVTITHFLGLLGNDIIGFVE